MKIRAFLCWLLLAVFCVVTPASSQALKQVLEGSSSSSEATEADQTKAREALIKVLEDPKQREALVNYLKSSEAPKKTEPDAGATPANETVAAQLGGYVQSVVSDFYEFGSVIAARLSGYQDVAEGQPRFTINRLLSGVLEILRVLIPAYLILYVGHWGLRRLLRRVQRHCIENGWVHRGGFLLMLTGLDAIVVTIAAGSGYIAALYFAEASGIGVRNPTLLESLTLDAFFLIEMARVAIRFVFCPGVKELRIFRFSDEEATFWTRHLVILVFIFGFGGQVLVPLVNTHWSYSLGSSVHMTVVLVSLAYLVTIIVSSRRRVRDAIIGYADNKLESEIGARVIRALAYVWHILALVYVFTVFVVWLSRPFDAVTFVASASGYSILIILISTFIVLAVTRGIREGIHLPETYGTKLPTLESRLNAILPKLLAILRILVILGAISSILEVWGFGTPWSWFWRGAGSDFSGRVTSALIVLLVGLAIWLGTMSWVDLQLVEDNHRMVTSRKKTLFKLFSNAFTILLLIMVLLIAMSQLGVQIAPLIAGAGVFGLALSFGSQKLVQDVINGAFIQLENAMNEGDVVELGGVTGTVERLTIRSVRLRDLAGTTHTIPFSSVTTVANSMKEFAYHVAIIGVAYDTDIDQAKEAMEEAFQRLRVTEYGAYIVGDYEMHGVINLGASSVDIRARIKTTPGDQWALGRAYTELVKKVFDERGIEIPFPQVTYHMASDGEKDETPPMLTDDTESKGGKVSKGGSAPSSDAGPKS
ncbi:mechanosensitive ion channel domain-containing protein [Pseudovibrio flavus]|uniref:mechanosensitive ion channel domain-containing protein n=1 Tax=Pseudovibrio flavus TaxID=2529854 RepID=UPI00211CFF36|nr:mechanosensitive ion channel domain-containing protein [Pseudovibrio flavus]